MVRFFAKNESVFKDLLAKWAIVQEIREILFVPYMITTEVQKVEFGLTDFYCCFKIMKMRLQKLNSNICYTQLAANLLRRLEERTPNMIGNQIMVCAMFLDPRFKKDLDAEQQEFAKLGLANMWKHIQSFKGIIEASADEVEMPRKKKKSTMEDWYAELDKFNEQYDSMTLQEDQNSSTDCIELAIRKYELFVENFQMKSKESVQNFWETHKKEFGVELYEIACALYAVPPTQASVERTFSALKYLFSYYRYRLSENMLESLMLIHTNSDLYYLIKEEELKMLKETLSNEI